MIWVYRRLFDGGSLIYTTTGILKDLFVGENLSWCSMTMGILTTRIL